MNPVSVKKDADYFIHKAAEISNVELVKDKILDRWYIQSKAKWVTHLYGLYQHCAIIRINPEHNVGHEIYGLFKKR
jgi:hypothetical protein